MARRKELMSAARRLIVRDGLTAVSVRNIAAEAVVSPTGSRAGTSAARADSDRGLPPARSVTMPTTS
jgi:AcrR family transcriptional regulator